MARNPSPPRTRGRRRIAVLAAALCAVTLAAGCGGSSSSDSGGSGTTSAGSSEQIDALRMFVPIQLRIFDPGQAGVQMLGTSLLALEPLVLYQPDGTFAPNLAERFEQVDPKTYVYEIRDGVEFWDGSPLTMDDVVFSLDIHRAKGTESKIASQWSNAESVKATGPHELTIKLKDPDPQFQAVVARSGIVSKAFYAKHGRSVGTPNTLNMGTGPYRIDSLVPSKSVELSRNPTYWGEAPSIEKLTLDNVPDDSARQLALQSGEADGVIQAPLSQVAALERLENVNVTAVDDIATYKFTFDPTKKPWDDIHLRRAFAHVVDRAAIASGIFKGYGTAGTAIAPPSSIATLAPQDDVDAAYAEIDEAMPDYDLDAARAEMAQSSVPDGVSVELMTIASDPTLAAIGQTVAQEAKKVGIDVQLKQVDETTYYTSVYFDRTTGGLSIDNAGADGPDPSNLPTHMYKTGTNMGNYVNPTVDGLLAKSRKLAVDDPQRGILLLDAMTTATPDLPYVPMVYLQVVLALDDKYQMRDLNPFWYLSRWPEQITLAQ